jgi:hypothetical protein
MVPRVEVEAVLDVVAQLVDVVENNVTKRVPKQLAATVTRRARAAHDALKNSLYFDSKES